MPGDVRRCELFSGAQGDERSWLTWKGLFMDVDNTVNFYSTLDEVVANGGVCVTTNGVAVHLPRELSSEINDEQFKMTRPLNRNNVNVV